jgi:hypothetical protein
MQHDFDSSMFGITVNAVNYTTDQFYEFMVAFGRMNDMEKLQALRAAQNGRTLHDFHRFIADSNPWKEDSRAFEGISPLLSALYLPRYEGDTPVGVIPRYERFTQICKSFKAASARTMAEFECAKQYGGGFARAPHHTVSVH